MMKVIIVTQKDPFYIPIFFKHFFEKFDKLTSGIEIAGVIIQKPLGQKSKVALIRKMLDFYGPVAFSLQALRCFLQITEKKLYASGILPVSFSIEYFLDKNKVELLKYKNVNSGKFVKFVEEEKIDLIVSVAASQIFKAKILKKPRLGCINIHNAPLPDYRGMLPTFWQMYHGEHFAGVSIHEMVEELDRGEIIYQDETKIEKGMSLDRLIKKAKKKNAEVLIRVLEMFKKSKVKYTSLPKRKGSYFSFPTKKDVSEFRKRGYRII